MDSVVTDNTGPVAAGVAVLALGGPVVVDATGSTISYNIASNEGGGLYLSDGVTWTGGLVLGNEATDGAGMYSAPVMGGGLVVVGVVFDGNIATDNGGGAYVEAATDFVDVVFDRNSAFYGGGAYLDNDGTFSGGAVVRNFALYGGGAHLNRGALTVASVDLGLTGATNNTPSDVRLRNGLNYDWDGVSSFACSAVSCL
jgi:hypothetical protein